MPYFEFEPTFVPDNHYISIMKKYGTYFPLFLIVATASSHSFSQIDWQKEYIYSKVQISVSEEFEKAVIYNQFGAKVPGVNTSGKVIAIGLPAQTGI